ncbi:type II secretion system protein J [uncultured Winogradskyella sp.]|uniref:PulJ/GspJ family protein n=1 Tax=uncultured Winogradskyella sp. TaxID=395353 RepID=UPI002617B121|nr:prepilin-type N-terminal cleavage/methylation domain-containing protein [uncultured Winogradskyella sp.]
MTIDNKIKSFTLQELLVTIIITAIVAGMAFSVLNMVQKHMWSIQKHMTANTALIQLEQSLWIDLNRYPIAKYDSKQSTLKLKSEIDSVNYHFSNDYIVKVKDTFNIKLKSKAFYFNGNIANSGTIDALKLALGKSPNEKILFVYKRSDANQFIK